MRKILISIKPKWVKKILNGEKTLEIRKTAPKCELPCEVYIYCTKENAKYFIENKIYNAMMKGKVVAKFVLNKVSKIKYSRGTWNCGDIGNHKVLWDRSCLNYLQLEQYLNGEGYAWHIDKLVPFDRPKELKDYGVKYSPQSYCFCEVDE